MNILPHRARQHSSSVAKDKKQERALQADACGQRPIFESGTWGLLARWRSVLFD
jgi:hypothetical protein